MKNSPGEGEAWRNPREAKSLTILRWMKEVDGDAFGWREQLMQLKLLFPTSFITRIHQTLGRTIGDFPDQNKKKAPCNFFFFN